MIVASEASAAVVTATAVEATVVAMESHGVGDAGSEEDLKRCGQSAVEEVSGLR